MGYTGGKLTINPEAIRFTKTGAVVHRCSVEPCEFVTGYEHDRDWLGRIKRTALVERCRWCGEWRTGHLMGDQPIPASAPLPDPTNLPVVDMDPTDPRGRRPNSVME